MVAPSYDSPVGLPRERVRLNFAETMQVIRLLTGSRNQGFNGDAAEASRWHEDWIFLRSCPDEVDCWKCQEDVQDETAEKDC